jgi:hypothetical protein
MTKIRTVSRKSVGEQRIQFTEKQGMVPLTGPRQTGVPALAAGSKVPVEQQSS